MTEQYITYFGYGSLVNRATRAAHEPAYPARLHGWQRVWGHRVTAVSSPGGAPDYRCCSLSVRPQKIGTDPALHDARQGPYFIDGVVANVAISDLPMLDKRESGYDRIVVPARDFDLPPQSTAREVHVYVSDAAHSGCANEQYPILQSYIDCVLAGYCELYDRAGMQHFVDSTTGWDGAIANDRNAPLYPRAVKLDSARLALFDELVATQRLNL